MKNPDVRKEWEKNNPDKVKEYARRSRVKNPERVKNWLKKYASDKTQKGYWVQKLAKLRCISKKRGLSFTLVLEDIKDLYSSGCVYCGSEISVKTIDRKDNAIGYVQGNCLSACWLCNRLKGNFMSFNEMVVMGEAIRKIKQNNPNFWCYKPW